MFKTPCEPPALTYRGGGDFAAGIYICIYPPCISCPFSLNQASGPSLLF